MSIRRIQVLGIMVACGPASPGETAASDTAATAPGADTTAAGSATSAGPHSSDLPALCGGFRDDAPGEGVPIRVLNVGASDIFLHSDCHERRWELNDSGEPPAYYPGPLFCATLRCEDALDEPCERACPLPCSGLPTLRIVPGGVFEDMWPQLVHATVDLPAECGSCGLCAVLRRITEGELLSLSVQVSATVQCAPGDECTCTPDPKGVCEIPGVLDSDATKFTEGFVFDGSPIELALGGA